MSSRARFFSIPSKQMAASEEIVRALVRVVAEGERERGTAGVAVYTDASDMQYVLLQDLPSDDLRERIGDMLSEEGHDFVFAVKGEATAAHIWKMPRAKIAEMVSG